MCRESLSNDYKIIGEVKYYNETEGEVKRSIGGTGKETLFYLNQTLHCTPPSTCIGFRLEFKQIEPLNPIMTNESALVFRIEQK